MSAVGGSVFSMTVNGRAFAVAADATVSIKLQKWTNEVAMNGDGSARVLKTLTAQTLESVVLSCNSAKDDLQYLTEANDSMEDISFTITLATGEVYGGKGQFVGDIKEDTSKATLEATVNLWSLQKL